MKILVTGATGTAGRAALEACLASSEVEAVTVLVRRRPEVTHPKLTVVLHEDFTRYDGVDLAGFEACLWCLGIAQSKVTAEAYARITYDATLAAAEALWRANPTLRFCFLSGSGADSREKSPILFARIKGKTENALMKRLPGHVVCFRPGYIKPEVLGAGAGLGERISFALSPMLRTYFPSMIITAKDLGRALLDVALRGSQHPILENNAIQERAR